MNDGEVDLLVAPLHTLVEERLRSVDVEGASLAVGRDLHEPRRRIEMRVLRGDGHGLLGLLEQRRRQAALPVGLQGDAAMVVAAEAAPRPLVDVAVVVGRDGLAHGRGHVELQAHVPRRRVGHEAVGVHVDGLVQRSLELRPHLVDGGLVAETTHVDAADHRVGGEHVDGAVVVLDRPGAGRAEHGSHHQQDDGRDLRPPPEARARDDTPAQKRERAGSRRLPGGHRTHQVSQGFPQWLRGRDLNSQPAD